MKSHHYCKSILVAAAGLGLSAQVTFADSLIAAPGDVIAGKTLLYTCCPAMNDKGQIIFNAGWEDGGTEIQGIFTPSTLLAAPGDVIDGRELLAEPYYGTDCLNDAGLAAMVAQFRQIVGYDRDGLPIYDGPKTGLITIDLNTGARQWILTAGETIEDVTLNGIFTAMINDENVILFGATGWDPNGEFMNGMYFTYDLVSGDKQLVLPHLSSVQGRDARISSFASFNDDGEIVLRMALEDELGRLRDNGLVKFPAPFLEEGGIVDGKLMDFIGCLSINDAGNTLF